MFTLKNLRTIFLSIVITLLFCAIVVTPAMADGGDGEVPALESPPDTESDPISSAGDTDSTPVVEEQNDGTTVEVNSQETDTPPAESETEDPAEADADPPISESEDPAEANTDPPVSESEDPAEADADPPVSESKEPVKNTPDQGNLTTETDFEEVVPVENCCEAVKDTSTSEESIQPLDAPNIEITDTISTGDPIWCPAAVGKPIVSAKGCTVAYTSLQDLITDLYGNEPIVDGVIWLEKDYDSSVNDPGVTAFTLNGSTLTTMSNSALTIRGGWNGLGTNSIDTTDPSEINARLDILNWNEDVTISDIEITGASSGSYALNVGTSEKTTLTRVRVDTNTLGGAYIDGTSDVMVSNSQFNNNTTGPGLYVDSMGTITLVDVSANSNNNDGAFLDNSSAATDKNVIMTSGTFEFNGNGGNGLVIFSNGAITLKDITADGNNGLGAYLINTTGSSAGVTLTGASFFSENTAGGLLIYSNGQIKGSNIIANVNQGGWGAYLDNSTASSAKSVTLTGLNEFKFNGDGLLVSSLGAITLSNVTASDNIAGLGASLGNAFGFTSNVNLTGVNIFNSNADTGLLVSSHGNISIANLTAVENGWGGSGDGAHLFNNGAPSAKSVKLTGENFILSNNGVGLYVTASGPITLSKVTSSDNMGGPGIYLENYVLGPSIPQNVQLNTYTTTDGNFGSGLEINTYGKIIITNLNANWNGWGGNGDGAFLNNFNGNATKPQGVDLKGTNNLNWNADSGLYVISFGPISVNNITADWNTNNYGASLNNNATGAVGTVNVKGTSSFYQNGDTGLQVWSRGNILVQNLYASENGGYGGQLFNQYTGKSSSVTVGTSLQNWCNGFNDNYNSGLEINSNGTVTLSNICASGNGDPAFGYGVYVYNGTATSPRPVTLKGSNRFSENYSGGLYVYATGAITASNVRANDNGGDGAHLANNIDPSSQQNVTLTGWNDFYDNTGYGLFVFSYGNITTNNLSTGWNGVDGAMLDNYIGNGTKPKRITLNGWNYFEWNGGNGLTVTSLGPIKGNNLGAYNNISGYGAYLFNAYSGAVGTVNVEGTSGFGSNGNSGLEVWSLGSIVVKDVDAFDNGVFGMFLYNAISGAKGNVTLGTSRARWCNGFWDNFYSGLEVYSNGVVTLNNICADSNGITGTNGYGVFVDNDTATSPRAVNVKGSNRFNDNYSGGLEVQSRGKVTASNLDAGDNGGNGVGLYNDFDPASQQDVTITGTNNFWHNVDNGIWISSFGSIKASNLAAEDNGTEGAVLDNYGGVAVARPKNITLTGTNTFYWNGGSGLNAYSWGAIKANNVTASDNGNAGAYLDNQWGPGSVGGITLTGVNSFDSNGSPGLVGFSHGPIRISNLSALWNGFDGVWLDTYGLSRPQNVTLTGTNTFVGNGDFPTNNGSGLSILADGQIRINNIFSKRNADHGVFLDNDSYAWPGTTLGIILTGTNTFYQNSHDGLYFATRGPVTLSKVTADDNGNSGVNGMSHSKINIYGGSMTFNGNYGWILWTPDVVTLKGVYAYGNSTNGLLSGGGTLITKRY